MRSAIFYLSVRCQRMGKYANVCPAQSCFGECSQWGYWTRPRTVEGCLQPREFESPTPRSFASTVPIDKFALSHILELVLGCVQYTESEAARRAAFFFSPCAIGLRSYRTRCCWIPSMLPILAKLGSGARSAYERAGFRAVARLSRDSRRVEILPCRAANSSALDPQLGAAPLPLPAARRSGC